MRGREGRGMFISAGVVSDGLQTKERNHLPPRQLPLRQFLFLGILRLIGVGKNRGESPLSTSLRSSLIDWIWAGQVHTPHL